MRIFPNTSQLALPNTSSDHCPLLATFQAAHAFPNYFRFENAYLKIDELKVLVSDTWSSMPTAQTLLQLHQKIQAFQSKISTWVRDKVGNIKSQILACKQFLGWIDKQEEIRAITDLEKRIKALAKKRYTILAVSEEDLWRQRSRLRWKLHGDRNTSFFHAHATSNKQNARISFVEHEGQQHFDHKTKAAIFFNQFVSLMGTE